MNTRTAERWVALELIAAVVLRTLQSFRSSGQLPGFRNYAAMSLGYGMASVFTFADQTAAIGPAIGGVILLGMLVHVPRDTTGKPLFTNPVTHQPESEGEAIGEGLSTFAMSVAASPTVYAQGVGSQPAPATSQPSSSGGGGLFGGLFHFDPVNLIPGIGGLPQLPPLPGLPIPSAHGFVSGIVHSIQNFLGVHIF